MRLSFGIHNCISSEAMSSCRPPTPNDGTYMNITEKCVYVSNATLKDTWHRARQQCRSKTGDLLILGSPSEHSVILEAVMDSEALGGDRFVWIGLYREGLVWERRE